MKPLYKVTERAEGFSLVSGTGKDLRYVEWPVGNGYWLYSSDGYTAATKAEADAYAGLVVYVVDDVKTIIKLPDDEQLRPYANLTFAQISSRIDSLDVAQLRRVIAWLIFINRESITDNFTNKLGN